MKFSLLLLFLLVGCSDQAFFTTDDPAIAVREYEGGSCHIIKKVYRCQDSDKTDVYLTIEGEVKHDYSTRSQKSVR